MVQCSTISVMNNLIMCENKSRVLFPFELPSQNLWVIKTVSVAWNVGTSYDPVSSVSTPHAPWTLRDTLPEQDKVSAACLLPGQCPSEWERKELLIILVTTGGRQASYGSGVPLVTGNRVCPMGAHATGQVGPSTVSAHHHKGFTMFTVRWAPSCAKHCPNTGPEDISQHRSPPT